MSGHACEFVSSADRGVRAVGPHESRGWHGPNARAIRLRLSLGLLLLAGCASAPPADANEAARPRTPDAEYVRSVLVGDETGLEVRQWLVIERSEEIPSVLARHIEESEPALPEHDAERLRRNGLRLLRVPVESLDSIAADLVLALDRVGRHGQVLRWQELHATPAAAHGHPRAVAIDGRARVFDRGTFQLMSRSWIVQMEDGPRVQLELLPVYREPDDPYRRLLGRPGPEVIAWPSMGVDALLEAGYAYILLSESPTVEWTSQHVNTSTNRHDTEAEAPPERRNVQRATAIGPDAPPPMTIGEMMLSTDGARRSRGMLVFVPHIAETYYAPAAEGDAERATSGSARR